MAGLALWQTAAIAITAVVCVGGMAYRIARLLGRRSYATPATARPGTAAESMLYGATAPEGAEVFDGFSYRVSARFAGRARVVVDGDSVSFTGPRVPFGIYALWIWGQGLTMALAPVLLVWALVALDWRFALWALVSLVASTLIMALGAGVWPGLGEVSGLDTGHFPALEFPRADVAGVKLGPGWADGGLSLVVLPYVKPIDGLAAGHAVSWWAPDDRGREARFALHCYDEAAAARLFGLLGGVAE